MDDTMVCTMVTNEKNAREFVWLLAQDGIPAVVHPGPVTARKADRRWHVAVPAIEASAPRVWMISIRGEPFDAPKVCTGDSTLKHRVTL